MNDATKPQTTFTQMLDGTSEDYAVIARVQLGLFQEHLDIDQRASFFQYAYSSAPAMVMRTIDAGSKYPVASRDADGNILPPPARRRSSRTPPGAAVPWARAG